MPFYRVLLRVKAHDGASLMDGAEAFVYRKEWCSSENEAIQAAVRRTKQTTELERLSISKPSAVPFQFDAVRATTISFWDWLTCGYRGLLLNDLTQGARTQENSHE